MGFKNVRTLHYISVVLPVYSNHRGKEPWTSYNQISKNELKSRVVGLGQNVEGFGLASHFLEKMLVQ